MSNEIIKPIEGRTAIQLDKVPNIHPAAVQDIANLQTQINQLQTQLNNLVSNILNSSSELIRQDQGLDNDPGISNKAARADHRHKQVEGFRGHGHYIEESFFNSLHLKFVQFRNAFSRQIIGFVIKDASTVYCYPLNETRHFYYELTRNSQGILNVSGITKQKASPSAFGLVKGVSAPGYISFDEGMGKPYGIDPYEGSPFKFYNEQGLFNELDFFTNTDLWCFGLYFKDPITGVKVAAMKPRFSFDQNGEPFRFVNGYGSYFPGNTWIYFSGNNGAANTTNVKVTFIPQ